jgi:hypothetical protein
LKKSLTIATLSNISSDPRPNRFANSFSEMGHNLNTFSFDKSIEISQHHLSLRFSQNKFFKAKSYLYKYIFFLTTITGLSFLQNWSLIKHLSLKKIDLSSNVFNSELYVIHDLILAHLFLYYNTNPNAKFIFDAREQYLYQNDESFFFRVFESRSRKVLIKDILKKADIFLTVSESIAESYKYIYSRDIIVVQSAPYFYEFIPSLPNTKLKFVHHGLVNKNRKIETMIDGFIETNIDAIFDLYLVGNKKYISTLKNRASKDNRISIKEPVAYNKLQEMLTNYDVGVVMLTPTTLNLEYCLPNKFFEYINSGLAVISSPLIEIKKIIEKYNLGEVSKGYHKNDFRDSFISMSKKNIYSYKINSKETSKELCFEKEFLKIIQEL